MKFKTLLRRSWRGLERASPTILAVVSGVGVVATAVLSAKATPKAIAIKQAYESAEHDEPDKKTTYKAVLDCSKCYVPTAITGIVTISCIFGGHAISQKRQKALMGAYVALGAAFSNYKSQVAATYGAEAEKEIQKAANETGEQSKDDVNLYTFIVPGLDEPIERTWGAVLAAEYNTNYFLQKDGYASLNDFYKELDLPPVEGGDEVGWSFDTLIEDVDMAWIPFINSPFTLSDGMQITKIELMSGPCVGYLGE